MKSLPSLRNLAAIAVIVAWGAGVLYMATAEAQVGGSALSASFGAMTLAATTATKVPATGTNGRNAIAVQNLDTAVFYCGYSTAVTAANGFQVGANGGVLAMDLSLVANTTGAVYCYSTPGTATGGLRWIEVRK